MPSTISGVAPNLVTAAPNSGRVRVLLRNALSMYAATGTASGYLKGHPPGLQMLNPEIQEPRLDAGNTCNVVRMAHILTSVRLRQSASATASGCKPSMRAQSARSTDDMTCAWRPQSRSTTAAMSLGEARSLRKWRRIRQASAWGQVTVFSFLVVNGD